MPTCPKCGTSDAVIELPNGLLFCKGCAQEFQPTEARYYKLEVER